MSVCASWQKTIQKYFHQVFFVYLIPVIYKLQYCQCINYSIASVTFRMVIALNVKMNDFKLFIWEPIKFKFWRFKRAVLYHYKILLNKMYLNFILQTILHIWRPMLSCKATCLQLCLYTCSVQHALRHTCASCFCWMDVCEVLLMISWCERSRCLCLEETECALR